MATEYIVEGVTTFAAAGWSGSGLADSNDFIVDKRIGPVTAGLDQSGLTEGIESIDFTPAGRGQVGSAGAPFKIDVDASSDAFFRAMGDWLIYYEADGDDNLCQNMHVGQGATVYIVGGTVTNLTMSGGRVVVEAGAIVTNVRKDGGTLVMEYNSTAVTLIEDLGGTTTIKRPYTTLNMGHRASIRDERETGAATTVNQRGGTYTAVRGDVANFNGYAGTLDCSQAGEAIALGGSSGLALGALNIIASDKVDVSGLVRPNAYQRSGSVSGF